MLSSLASGSAEARQHAGPGSVEAVAGSPSTADLEVGLIEVTDRLEVTAAGRETRSLRIRGGVAVPPRGLGAFAVRDEVLLESVTDATGHDLRGSAWRGPGAESELGSAAWHGLRTGAAGLPSDRGHLPFELEVPLPGPSLVLPLTVSGGLEVRLATAVEVVRLPLDRGLTRPRPMPDGMVLRGMDVRPPNLRRAGFVSIVLELKQEDPRRAVDEDRPQSSLIGGRLIFEEGDGLDALSLLPPYLSEPRPRRDGGPGLAWVSTLHGRFDPLDKAPRVLELWFATAWRDQSLPIRVRLGEDSARGVVGGRP